MTVLKIQNVYLASTDARLDADFYQTALGAEVRFADANDWIQLNLNGYNMALASERESAVKTGAVIVFEVDDMEIHESAITKSGGTVIGKRDMGSHGRTLTFADPTGNIGQLYQRT